MEDDNCGRPWNDPHPFGIPLKPKPQPKPLETETSPAKRPESKGGGKQVNLPDEHPDAAARLDEGWSPGCTCGLVGVLGRGAANGLRTGIQRAAMGLARAVPRLRRRQRGGGGGTAATPANPARAAAISIAASAPSVSFDDDLSPISSPTAGVIGFGAWSGVRTGCWPPPGLVALCELDLTTISTTASWRNHSLDADAKFGACPDARGGDGGSDDVSVSVDMTAPTPAPTPRIVAISESAVSRAATAASPTDSLPYKGASAWHGTAAAAAAAAIVLTNHGNGSGSGAPGRASAYDRSSSSSDYEPPSFRVSIRQPRTTATSAAAAAAATGPCARTVTGPLPLPPTPPPPLLPSLATALSLPAFGCRDKRTEEGVPLLTSALSAALPAAKA